MNAYGQLNVSGWTEITQVAAGERHNVGVKSDGTVVAVGYNEYGECNVSSWNLLVPCMTPTPTISPTISPTASPTPSPTLVYMLCVDQEFSCCDVYVDGYGIVDAGTWWHFYDIPENTVINVSASFNPYCNTWNGWIGDDVANSSAMSTTVTMNTSKHITASCSPYPWATPTTSPTASPTTSPTPSVSPTPSPTFPTEYNLTINSTGCGAVFEPGEGVFCYSWGEVVELLAVPPPCYGCNFIRWTGDTGTIADVNSSHTNISMYGNYSITAEFTVSSCGTPTPSPTITITATVSPTPSVTPTATPVWCTPRMYGDASGDGYLDSFDLAVERNIILEKSVWIPWGDCNGDGDVDAGDLACIRNVILAKDTVKQGYEVAYDFNTPGAGTDDLALWKNVISRPADIFISESGWTNFSSGDYEIGRAHV
jgi:hypothetical protein